MSEKGARVGGGLRARVEGAGVRVGAGGRWWETDLVPKVQMCQDGGGSRAHTHTCRRVLRQVELEPLHLGDEVAAAPGGRGISVDRGRSKGWV